MAVPHEQRRLLHDRIPDGALFIGVAVLAVATGLLPMFGVSPLLVPLLAALLFVSVGVFEDHRYLIYAIIPAYFLPLGFLPEVVVSALVVIPTVGGLVMSAIVRDGRPRLGVIRLPLTVLVLDLTWSLVAVSWATDGLIARQTLVQYLLSGALAGLLMTQITDRRSLDRAMMAIAVGGWVLIGASLLEVAQSGVTEGVRFQVFDANQNQVTLLLTLGALGVLWPAVTRPVGRRGWPTVASFVYLALSAWLISASGSRGGLLSIAVLLLTLAPFRRTRRWGVVGLAGGILSFLVAPSLYSTVLARFLTPDDAIGRSTLATGAVQLISDNPFLGAGLGNGPTALLSYLRPLVQTDVLGRSTSYPAHNPFLEVAADSGMVGLVVYATLLGSALFCVADAIHANRRNRGQLTHAYVILTTSVTFAYALSWVKSGGVSHGPTFFVIVGMLCVGPRVSRFPDQSIDREPLR